MCRDIDFAIRQIKNAAFIVQINKNTSEITSAMPGSPHYRLDLKAQPWALGNSLHTRIQLSDSTLLVYIIKYG
jgi:hypothetical protein